MSDPREETKARIVELYENESNLYDICMKVGISYQTLFNWKRKDNDFSDKLSTIKNSKIKSQPAWIEKFLEEFKSNKSINKSAALAGIAGTTAYYYVRKHKDFADKLEELRNA